MNEPLAERLRPKTLDQYLSQTHLIGEKGALRQQIKRGIIPSMIFWGPPGVGKTTLANIIANESDRPFFTLSAISSGVKDVREVIEKAKRSDGLFTTKSPILFIDEIHRFSKSQQDSLLGAVEKGWVTLIGATTENPSFEVISALLSRCQVYVLKPFSKEDLIALLNRAMKEDKIIASKNIKLKETEAILRLSGGDARKLLNIFELLVNSSDEGTEITNDMVFEKVQQKYPKATLLLIGSDSADIKTGSTSTWALIQQRIEEKNLSGVQYLGKMPYSEVKKYIKKTHVCVFPSYAETLGMVTIESMALQKAVVNTNIGWAKG